jgi:hypothetical protein
VCVGSTVVVSSFTDDIADFFAARIGFWGVIGGGLAALALLLRTALRLDDECDGGEIDHGADIGQIVLNCSNGCRQALQ